MTPTAAELARRFADSSMTPLEAVEEILATIERLDPELGAWQAVYAEDAQRLASAATEQLACGRRIGPFHGIPFALKDIVDLEGRATTGGSAALAGRVSATSATIARRLMAAGGILIGKTKTVELALGGWGTNEYLGTPRNPWDGAEVRVPGGSSSGSGVAVAAGMVPCAVGTDTGGSVRLPAAFCGIVGLKTTEGMLPTDGIIPLSHTLDTPGPMARTVADAGMMFDVLRGRHPVDTDDDWRLGRGWYGPRPGDLDGIVLGSLTETDRAVVSQPVLDEYDRAIEQLEALGARVRPVAMPRSYEELADLTFVIVTAEAWFHHGHLFGDETAPLDQFVRARALPGREVTAERYIGAIRTREEVRRELLAAMEGVDALVTPTTPDSAPLLAEVDEKSTPAHFTRVGNLLATAAISVPSGLTSGRMPSALQFIGRGNDEEQLLAVAGCYEAARGPLPPPPLH